MAKISRRHKAGLPPGALVHLGGKRDEEVKITVIDYSETELYEKELKKLKDCCLFKDTPTVTWIDVDGIHEVDVLKEVGECYNLHPLVLEDIVTTDQRPKLEDYKDYLFIVLRALRYDESKNELAAEQISLILGPNHVLTFQERNTDVFNAVKDRIRKGANIRKKGADYLAYSLMDALVDSYFVLLEQIGEKIEDLEDELLEEPMPETLQTLQDMKRAMITLRKSVWPIREIIGSLEREEPDMVKEPTKIYLRDLYDHTIQVIDTIETDRDILAGMLDIYLSSISNRMNEIMKVLTVIATIFIPLTFITGLYGMNFNPGVSPYSMPELNWEWGYLSVWGIILAVGLGMMMYFRKKKWI